VNPHYTNHDFVFRPSSGDVDSDVEFEMNDLQKILLYKKQSASALDEHWS
jgi:hypothetical protein